MAWLAQDSDAEGELSYWTRAFHQQCHALRDDLRFMVPKSQHVINIDDTGNIKPIPTLAEWAKAEFTAHDKDPALLAACQKNAVQRLHVVDDLIDRCQQIAMMDFEFLYDTEQGLLSIGYDVGERRRDPSCYEKAT
jgi:hypothetical protein